MKIYPSILTDSLEIAQKQIDSIQDFKKSDIIQMDIVDGDYADNLTITPLDVPDLELPETLKIDFHLMTYEPMDYFIEVEQIKNVANVRAVIAQIEKMSYQTEFVQEAKAKGFLIGLSLDLFTPVEAIEDDSWDLLDIVQVMGIEAGFQGQEFHPRILKKIEAVKTKIRTRKQQIELIVDGGIKLDNYQDIIEAGADSLAVGSQIWQADDPVEIINQFKV